MLDSLNDLNVPEDDDLDHMDSMAFLEVLEEESSEP